MYRLQFVASCNTVRRSAAIGNLALTFSFTVFLPFESWKKQRVSSTSLLPNSSTKCTVQYMLYNSFSTEPKIDCSCARARSRAPFLFRWREESCWKVFFLPRKKWLCTVQKMTSAIQTMFSMLQWSACPDSSY